MRQSIEGFKECVWVMPFHEPPKETPEVLFVINRKSHSKANVHMQSVGLCSKGLVPQVSIRTMKHIKAGTELFADYDRDVGECVWLIRGERVCFNHRFAVVFWIR